MNFLTKQHPNLDTIGPIAVHKKQIVCLYFSAFWCPPCQNFTPVLKEFYLKVNNVPKNYFSKKKGQGSSITNKYVKQKTITYTVVQEVLDSPFEVIYVSKDTSSEMFEKAIKGIPWLSLPFEDARIDEFFTIFKIRSIPSLVVLGNRGELVTLDGRIDLMTKGLDSWLHWTALREAEDFKRKNTQQQVSRAKTFKSTDA